MSWKLFGYGLCGILDIENLGDESRDKKFNLFLHVLVLDKFWTSEKGN